MSLAIDVDRIESVLLSDGWHSVHGNSFLIDAYEYLAYPEGLDKDPDMQFAGGEAKELIPAAGASWRDVQGHAYFCPMTSILAVRYSDRERKKA
jgi:hypothetical protein